MNNQHKMLIERINASGREFLAYVVELSEQEIHRAPAANEWSVHAVVAHMRDVEQHVFLKRIQRILSEEHPRVENFDQEQWNREHYSAEEPLYKIVTELSLARNEELKLLHDTPDADWSRWGVHPEYGKISIEFLALHNYSHTLEHLHQILVMREQKLLRDLNAG